MRPEWTGDVVKAMHCYEISKMQLAEEMGCSIQYVSLILADKRRPPLAEKWVTRSLARLIEQKYTEEVVNGATTEGLRVAPFPRTAASIHAWSRLSRDRMVYQTAV